MSSDVGLGHNEAMKLPQLSEIVVAIAEQVVLDGGLPLYKKCSLFNQF